jgi:hypothetical protein
MEKMTFQEIVLDFFARLTSTKFLISIALIGYFIYMDYKGTPSDINTIIGTITAIIGYSASSLVSKQLYIDEGIRKSEVVARIAEKVTEEVPCDDPYVG